MNNIKTSRCNCGCRVRCKRPSPNYTVTVNGVPVIRTGFTLSAAKSYRDYLVKNGYNAEIKGDNI